MSSPTVLLTAWKSVAVLIAYYATNYMTSKRELLNSGPPPIDYALLPIKSYDFIVVGAGAAGCVVADRLSSKFTVLLLEAGGYPIPQSYVPLLHGFLIQEPILTHEWISVKQFNSNLERGGITKYKTGKFLGGSTVVNGLSYNRGHPKDYDEWATILEDDSWKYNYVLKFFKGTENFGSAENPNGDLGNRGPLSITKAGNESDIMYQTFINAGKELGYPTVENFNDRQKQGFGPLWLTTRLGRRVSAYDAFLERALTRRNLVVSRYSVAHKIEFDDKNRAVGVYYSQFRDQRYVRAKKEIILSAGVMNSPKILMNSGIGPANQLRSAKIPVRANLPVGQNLLGRPLTAVYARFPDGRDSNRPKYGEEQIHEYLEQGTGPLSNTNAIGQAFLVSSIAKAEGNPDWPDLQLIFDDTSFVDSSIAIYVLLSRAKSRGTLTFDLFNRSSSAPLIWDPNWLEDPQDRNRLAEGAKIAAQILNSEAFRDLGVEVDKNLFSACKKIRYDSDAYWKCYVRQSSLPNWNHVGSCRMGAKDDPSAVVGLDFRVRRVHGLRVVDNSVQPTTTNANAQAPTILIAQRAAKKIYKHNKPKKVKPKN